MPKQKFIWKMRYFNVEVFQIIKIYDANVEQNQTAKYEQKDNCYTPF